MIQEAYAVEYLGPTQSLNAHHSRSWEVASDLIFENVCRALHEQHPKIGGNVATAITHPEIMDISNEGKILECFFRINFYLAYVSVPSWMTAIQMYLRDQERAGGYFVDGGMYASLSMHLVKLVLAFSGDDQEKQKENDGNDTSDDMDDDHMFKHDNKRSLDFAIRGLPFYLSNADYNPKLVELSRSIMMLNQEMKKKLVAGLLGSRFLLWPGPGPKKKLLMAELPEVIEELCEAIDLYLKKEPLTPNDAQPNESQAVAERFRADKRRRESNDDLEVTGASALSLTSKRTKVMDGLSPTEVLGSDPDSEEPMSL
ncbi:hypothetical protein GALMADRAFT_243913 [Galerina marginata CBS 339.88]|uniref:Uncharacterized protein n=1 Tax=Galerina marginata (strain CBS 339.88) TaxID=685588 RepID=A0A067THT0_GALM3|nr:hypothetical protein GALMADRAFT_243913 [Galerina marginata CBS 339.88]